MSVLGRQEVYGTCLKFIELNCSITVPHRNCTRQMTYSVTSEARNQYPKVELEYRS